ncbi:hypothetical protein XVE_0866 [Xanthomonas vesicatoria ATCC 35937]|uniref:Lipoprotein n=1 Tax=Xanthomonas vesicatoria ATCC 35937 TaxID=925775 RepID=F0B9W2_9XANT|nr:hypothetical protein XVE_0866 [Xanthomonas vesicatoria ATCC 35937]
MAKIPMRKKCFLMVAILSAISLLSSCNTLRPTKACMDKPLKHYIHDEGR